MSDFFSYADTPAPAPVPPASAPQPALQAALRPAPAPQRAILAALDDAEWQQFIAFAARRRYPPGAVVVAAGDTAPVLWFVASGVIELRGMQGVAAGQRGEGEVLGLLGFLDGAASSVTASVSAAGPADLLLLSHDALQRLAAWQPRIALALLRDLGAHVAARLRQLQPGD